MAYTNPPFVTNGVDNITAAEMNTYIRDNLEFFRTRAAGFVYVDDDWEVSTIDGTDTSVFTGTFGGTDTTLEWGNATLVQPTSSTSTLTTIDGVVYAGGMAKHDLATGVTDRKFEVKRLGDAVEFCRWRHIGPVDDKNCRMSGGTTVTFSTTNDDVYIESMFWRSGSGAGPSMTGEPPPSLSFESARLLRTEPG